MQRQRARGDSFWAIAADLNQAKVPTAQGGKRWYAATVRHVLLRTS
jgi:Recombinase